MAVATRGTGCVLIVAAAGYGKSSAVEPQTPALHLTAAELLERLPDGAGRQVSVPGCQVVVDELCRLSPRDQVRLVRGVAGYAARCRLTLLARYPLARRAAVALPEPVTEQGPADLALGPAETSRVLREEHGVTDADLAWSIHDLTAGWPALVHLAGDAVARHGVSRGDLLPALADAGTPGAAWVRDQVLAELPPPVGRLLDLLVDLDPVSGRLCSTVAGAGAAEWLWWLERVGLVVRGPAGTRRLVPVVGAVAARQPRSRRGGWPSPGRAARLRRAATWYAGHGDPLAAARMLARLGEPRACGELIEARGDEMLAAGGAAELIGLVEALPDPARTPGLRLVLGNAYRVAGDVAGAHRVFAPLLADAAATGRWPAGLVWRAAMLPYLRADYRAALDLLDRAPAPADTVDDALVLAGRASTLVQLGLVERATAEAERALAAAGAADGAATGEPAADGAAADRALAAAHIAAALTTSGARRDTHLAEALAAAERAGDVLQQARVLANQAHCLLHAARYPQALAVSRAAVRTAGLGGPPGVLVTALHNAGEALIRLGRFDEAALHFERSLRISQRAGLDRAAPAVLGLAEINRVLGRREQARAGLEEAVTLARDAGDLQVLVPALATLARLLAGAEADARSSAPAAGTAPAAGASEVAAEAERVAPPYLVSRAFAARGWVALAAGDHDLAGRRAADAVRAARSNRQGDALAEALELAAATATGPDQARAALQEAAGIWQRAGAQPAADQVLVLLARLPGADTEARSAARSAAVRLVALGVGDVDGEPLVPGESAATPVRVEVLGRFQVLVGGRPVPLPAWRSRQARTLLKILVAGRGRPIHRTELCELLWPDDEPQRTAHRLSVLLSAVRTVLDPTRRWPADHYLRADLTGVSFDISRMTVDVEELLRDVAHGLRLARDGDAGRAREVLAEADAAYRGEAFADEPYEDWADGLREQVRAAWLRGLRTLAGLYERAGDLDQAAGCLVRMLAVDGCDEPAYRSLVTVLVRAGRHGEARRAFGRWTGAMRSIDAPLPDRSVLRPGPPAGPVGSGTGRLVTGRRVAGRSPRQQGAAVDSPAPQL